MRVTGNWLRLLLLWSGCVLQAVEVQFAVRDEGAGEVLPARIHLRDAQGKAQRAKGYPFWHDHFVCNGKAELQLENGQYAFTVERGPEFSVAIGQFQVRGQVTNITVSLKRIADLAKEGYWSGETHVHRELADIELLMRAEDLHVAQVITWWNKKRSDTPPKAVKKFDGNRFFDASSGEDERDGGALLFCDLPRPLDITAGSQHFPSSYEYAKEARASGAKWIDAEKPFWWDFPMWVANDLVNTVGIANNHMNRSGMYENEAWGRPRDREKYPPPVGNALWSQQIYYHALNCGLRLPPSAGSASGVLPNPVGYNRAYVYVDGEFTYEKWREGLLAGRSFVSNGPLLRCRANGELPGHVFKTEGAIELQIDGRLDSRDPIRTIELVKNGEVSQIALPTNLRFERSGWFLVRAIADITNTFRFASTAPWFVEIDGRPLRARRASAEFFLDWCRERTSTLQERVQLSPAQKEQVLEPWRIATRFWQEKLGSTE